MRKKEQVYDNLLSQFSNGEELLDFLKQLQKRGIEKLLEGELESHLGYKKHEKSKKAMPEMLMVKRPYAQVLESLTYQFPETEILLLSL